MASVAPTGNYLFQSEPKAVAVSQRKKYRDAPPPVSLISANIHYDKRVVRGNTYASQVPTASQQRLSEARESNKPKRRTRALSARTRDLVSAPVDDGTAAVDGRQHMTVQTDDYLEELVDKVLESDQFTQTDPIVDRPQTPKFAKPPLGVNQSTSIEPFELFDFELAVEPILEVLIGKGLDQSQQEVLEEEELKILKARREEFERQRAAAIAESQRLEAASQRRFEEKQRLLEHERQRLEREKDVAQKVAARTTARAYLAGLQNSVLTKLETSGHFYDPIVKHVEGAFMPWLINQVAARLHVVDRTRTEVDSLIQSAVDRMVFEVKEKQRREREAAEAELRRKADEAETLRREVEAEKQRLAEEAQRLRNEAIAAESSRKADEARASAEVDNDGDRDGGDDGDGDDG